MRFVLLVASLVLSACIPAIFDESDCTDRLLSAVPSANQLFVANLVRRECGATVAAANIVFLKRAGEHMGTDAAWGEKVYVSQGESSIAVDWRGSELRIRAPITGKDVFLRKDAWGAVTIVYE